MQIVALTAAELEEAVARYSKTTVLRALLTHDPALGGVAIKLISVRWLISYFQANPSARLEHRQHCRVVSLLREQLGAGGLVEAHSARTPRRPDSRAERGPA